MTKPYNAGKQPRAILPSDSSADAAPGTVVEGEGSDAATGDSTARAQRFIESGQVEEAAREAAPDSEAREGEDVEKIGRSHAAGK